MRNKRGVRDEAQFAALPRLLREWTDGLAPGTAIVECADTKDEIVFRVIPARRSAARFSCRLSRSSPECDLALGDNTSVSDTVFEEATLAELCRAVQDGKVAEDVWRRRGRGTPVRCRTVVHLPSRSLHFDRSSIWYFVWAPLNLLNRSTVRYEALKEAGALRPARPVVLGNIVWMSYDPRSTKSGVAYPRALEKTR